MSFWYDYISGRSGHAIVWALLVLILAVRWINEYRKNQIDYDNDLERQLEILKCKNAKNKQKGTQNDTKS